MTLAIDRLAQTGRWRTRPLAEKALPALGLLALALTLPPWPGAALVLAAAWGLALAGARVPARDWLALCMGPLGFILTGSAVLAVDISTGGIRLAADGGTAALHVALRAAAATSCLLLLAVTCTAAALIGGLRRLGLPAELAEVAQLTWRFVFLLLDSARAIHASQAARLGWTDRRRAMRSAGLLVAALLPNALDRARRLEIGLAARGFDGRLRMLSPVPPATARGLAAAAMAPLAVAGVSLWLT